LWRIREEKSPEISTDCRLNPYSIGGVSNL
jgi:hypothetical protein